MRLLIKWMEYHSRELLTGPCVTETSRVDSINVALAAGAPETQALARITCANPGRGCERLQLQSVSGLFPCRKLRPGSARFLIVQQNPSATPSHGGISHSLGQAAC